MNKKEEDPKLNILRSLQLTKKQQIAPVVTTSFSHHSIANVLFFEYGYASCLGVGGPLNKPLRPALLSERPERHAVRAAQVGQTGKRMLGIAGGTWNERIKTMQAGPLCLFLFLERDRSSLTSERFSVARIGDTPRFRDAKQEQVF